MYTRCLNKNCPDQCQFFSPSDPPVALTASITVGGSGLFNYRTKCRNCGCYEHQHHVQGFMIGSSFVPVSEPPSQPQQTTLPHSAGIRHFSNEASSAFSSSPPFSSTSSDNTTTSNRKLTVDEATSNNTYANMEQQRRKESDIRSEMASVYSNNAAAAPPRFRGTGRSVQNRLNNKKRASSESHRMPPPPTTLVKPNPSLDLYLLRIGEKAPCLIDGLLMDDLKQKGQYLKNFEFCRDDGQLISEAYFYYTYALQCKIAPAFLGAQGNYDFYLQIGRRQLIKLRYSNETFPGTADEWKMMGSNCGTNSTHVNTSDHRWLIVAPRSDNTHHKQQRRASKSASSHCSAEDDDLLDEEDEEGSYTSRAHYDDVNCSSSRVEEEEGSYIPSTLRQEEGMAAGRSKHHNIQFFNGSNK